MGPGIRRWSQPRRPGMGPGDPSDRRRGVPPEWWDPSFGPGARRLPVGALVARLVLILTVAAVRVEMTCRLADWRDRSPYDRGGRTGAWAGAASPPASALDRARRAPSLTVRFTPLTAARRSRVIRDSECPDLPATFRSPGTTVCHRPSDAPRHDGEIVSKERTALHHMMPMDAPTKSGPASDLL